MKRRKTLPAGFTLIEVAIALLVGGLVIMAGAIMLTDYIKESRMITTQNRLQEIDSAIIQYLNVNGVLPCVASPTALQDSTTFGRALTDPAGGDCYNSAGAGGTFKITGTVPAAITSNVTGHVVMGAVPVRTLGLPDADIADAWGDRFAYAVTDALTVAGPPSLYDPTQGSISVVDSNDEPVAVTGIPPVPGTAQYVIISYGPDRAGAHTLSGASSGVKCPLAAPETMNCAVPPSGTFRKTTLNSNKTSSIFDDYVIFHTQISLPGIVPVGLVTPFASPPALGCPSGWRAYLPPGTACSPQPGFICCQKF